MPALAILLASVGGSASARAEEPLHRPLAEPVFTESVTDIDGDPGEVEYEANLAKVAARKGGASAAFTSLEVEWRALENLGLRLEPSYTRLVDTGGTSAHGVFGVNGGIGIGLLHDLTHDLHLQAELLGRSTESDGASVFEPESTVLPFAADLLAAVRSGAWTLRATVGGEAGGAFAHAPAHTDAALLWDVDAEGSFGFLGLEARTDWARAAPLVLAPEVVANLAPLGLPFTLSTALPMNLWSDPRQPSFGVFVRLLLLSGREFEYGRAITGS